MKRRFNGGNIVRWNGSLWIVHEWRDAHESNGRKFTAGVDLIAADASNLSAMPTEDWPSKTKGLASVEFVASNMMEYIKQSMATVFGGFK